jgi:hypothetical protein
MDGHNRHGLQVDARAIRRGAWVFGIGSVVSMVGLALAGNALAAAARQYVQQMEGPPAELARRSWHQARHAATAGATAGAQAWHQAAQNGHARPDLTVGAS